MRELYTNPNIVTYAFEDIPRDEEVWVMDERHMAEYDAALQDMENVFGVGAVTRTMVQEIGEHALELTEFIVYERHHQVRTTLSRADFVTCVDRPGYDLKPRMFVKSEWLNRLHTKNNSIFVLIDAIDVKIALRDGTLTRDGLVALRDRVDELAAQYPTMSFVSFADSLLIKSNWTAGSYDSDIDNTYHPELIPVLVREVQSIYQDVLKMKVYAVVTQGTNEYYEDATAHVSPVGNHFSLNSLGLPFAELMAIEAAVRHALQNGDHPSADLYMEHTFYLSLNFDGAFPRNDRPKYPFPAPMRATASWYYAEDCATVCAHLRVKLAR